MASVASRARALPSVGPLSTGLLLSLRRCSPCCSRRRCTCAPSRSASRSGWTRGCRSGSRPSRSSTSRACCGWTARRRSTTCCSRSGWTCSATARPTRRASRWSIALLAIPGGLWAGWSLFGRRAGLICAALCAVNPFLTNYAQETRMYSLMLLLSLLTRGGVPARVRVPPTASYLPAFVVFLRAARVHPQLGPLHGGGLARRRSSRAGTCRRTGARFVRDALLGFGGVGLLYLPWVPTLLHQIQHTGAPWLNSPRLRRARADLEGPPGRRHAHRGAAARRWLRARGDPAAAGGRQGAHGRRSRASSCRWRRWRWRGSCRRSRPRGPPATSASSSGRCCW